MFGTICWPSTGRPAPAGLVRRLAAGGDVAVRHVTEIMPIHGTPPWTWTWTARAGRPPSLGRELEQAGMPTKVELVRAVAGHVARIILEAARDHQAR